MLREYVLKVAGTDQGAAKADCEAAGHTDPRLMNRKTGNPVLSRDH